MNLSELLASRDTAGERYRKATIELHAGFVDLAATEEILANANVGYDGRANLRTFFNVPQNLQNFAHPKYAALDSVTCWREEIKARRDDIRSTFNQKHLGASHNEPH